MTAQVTDLIWRGSETVAAATAALAARANVALHLPADLHHAVAAHLESRARREGAERLDVSGGAELIARLAAIRGLEALAALEAPVADERAQVRVVSPSPIVAIVCTKSQARGT